MKITNEQLVQIIKEEIENFLDEGVFGPKVGRQLSPDKYHYDKKDKPKRRDTGYKGDDYDIDDINKKMAKKFGGKYKKIKEEESPVEGIITSLGQDPDGEVLSQLYYKIKALPSTNAAQDKAKKSAYANIGSALKDLGVDGATNMGRVNFLKRAIDALAQYDRADSVDVQDPTME